MALFRRWVNPLTRIARSSQMEPAAAENQSREDSPTPAQNGDGHTMSQDPSPGIADLVEHMNETAGKSPSSRELGLSAAKVVSASDKYDQELGPRRSPRKRASPRVLGPNPELIKRRRTADLPTSSGRLRRKSMPFQPRPSRQNRDSYEIQVGDSDGAEEAERAPKAPLLAAGRKQVRALKKKAANASPLKGLGEIQMRATNEVNIHDSPSKKPIGRPKKVEIRPRTKNHEDKAIPVSESDPESLSGSHEDSEDSEDETRARQSAARQKKNSKRRPALRKEQAVQTANAEMPGSDSGTASRSKTREEERREREDKREKDRAKELKGIESIANLHRWGSDMAWGDLFAAVTELVDLKNTTEPESRQGAKLCSKIHWIADRYRAADKESEYEDEEDLPSMTDDIQSLAKSVWRYPKNCVPAANERAKKGRDLYGHIVLDLVRLLKKVLHNRQKQETFGEPVYDVMCKLLETAWNAADLACKWQPRPSQLDGGVLRLMRDDVRKNLGFLKEKYLVHRQDYSGTKEEQTLDDVAKVQKKAGEYLWGTVLRRRQEIQEKNRRRVGANEAVMITNSEMSEGERNDQDQDERAVEETDEASSDRQLGLLTPPSETEVLDNFHVLQRKNQEAQDNARKERRSAILNKNHRRPDTTGVVAATEQAVLDIDDLPSPSHPRSETTPTPARGKRAHTEEIPAPVQPPVWTRQERIAFENLLRRYGGPSRFEQILARYGGRGGLLQRHDLDSLMSHASFLEESLVVQIREEPEKYVWLTGAP